ncbi:hypothetical protein HCN51_21625 [Nonomuraea sp. FMUSA5-5]|uniref:Uncharacterized protein n=1 Tax=Nonomuraea composti TaxID=2720023 RepID=A0ABX1B8E8_9ACTN|nr:hypothetical protein [Nonomuraea sp. FMUSA5-5]NJP92029.1 hypothetical protein [Nonomuraea sp. FMUSA5-5]
MQLKKAPDRIAGHLAAGVLGDSNVVLVPDPPAALLQTSEEIEVLIAPNPPTKNMLIERHEIAQRVTYALRGRANPVVAAFQLVERSRYASQMYSFDPVEVGRVLEENGGCFWKALVRVGAVPPKIRKVSEKFLREANEKERIQRRPKMSDFVYDSYSELVPDICQWLCWCSKHSH